MKTTPPPTIAEALRRISADPDLKDGQRRQWRCCLGALAKLHRLPPETIRLDPRESIALIERSSPAALNITEASMANYRAGLRAALRYFGLLAARPKSEPVEDPAWLALLAQLPPKADFERLRAFIQWLASQRVAPGAVGQSHLEAYLTEREANRGGGKQVSQPEAVDAARALIHRIVINPGPPDQPPAISIEGHFAAMLRLVQPELPTTIADTIAKASQMSVKGCSRGSAPRKPSSPRPHIPPNAKLRAHGALAPAQFGSRSPSAECFPEPWIMN